MREPRLNEIDPKTKFGRDFINKIIRRIECTKPKAGNRISINEEDDGIKINLKSSITQITVCEGGSPRTISVLTP